MRHDPHDALKSQVNLIFLFACGTILIMCKLLVSEDPYEEVPDLLEELDK